MENNTATGNGTIVQENTKFCKHCGSKIHAAAVVCTQCGCQVEEIKHAEQPSIVINNANNNTNTNVAADAAGRVALWILPIVLAAVSLATP